MDVYEFASRHLSPYRQSGNEIVPELCPFCHGGEHRDRRTFALNVEKRTYNCRRGSCGKQGTFSELCRAFGEEPDRKQTYVAPMKHYKRPETVILEPTEQIRNYLKLRKLSDATLERYRIGADEKGNIVFPYYDEKDELVFVKFRPSHKVAKGERKAWREADTKPVLFGMHLCDPQKPLVIHEGEIDCMSSSEAGIENCVSVPSGAEDMTWLDTCWEFIDRFDTIFIYGDSDEAGRRMVRELSVKLSHKRVFDVRHERKDANEILYFDGPEAVRAYLEQAREVPPYGLIDLADVEPFDPDKVKRVRSGIRELDRAIGGFLYGDLSVWTAKRGEGKSTLLSQLMLEAVDAGEHVCVYSGELRAERFQYWMYLQAAGDRHLTQKHDPVTDRVLVGVPRMIAEQIRDWHRGKIWLYDNTIAEGNEADSILKAFELAARRYDCHVFLVDNLMTARYASDSDSAYYRAQSTFVGKLVEFANRMNVHVHLVAHPRKTNGKLENDDISGSGDIANRASNVFALERLQEEKNGASSVLSILKNRWDGAQNKIGLGFSPLSRRLYMPSDGNIRVYGWDQNMEQEEWLDVPTSPDMPF